MNRLNSRLAVLLAGSFLTVSGAQFASHASTNEEITDKDVASASLSGAYLAARIATIDKNTEAAVRYYRRALSLDPGNPNLMQNAFMTLLANGNVDEAMTIAADLTELENGPQIANIALAVDAVRGKELANARTYLTYSSRSDLDRLVGGLMKAWIASDGKTPEKALEIVDELQGPAWFNLFIEYHGGLLAAKIGQTEEAYSRLGKAIDRRSGGSAASETHLRAVEMLARIQFAAGATKEAEETVTSGRRVQSANPALARLDEELRSGKGLTHTPMSAQRGTAEIFYTLGTAIDDEGGLQFAMIYLNLSRALAMDSDIITLALADLFDKQKLYRRSNELFSAVSDASPYHRIAQLELALNLDALDQLDEASKSLEGLLKDDPDDLIAYLSYGGMMSRHEKYAEAAAIYERAAARVQTPRRIHWNLYYRRGIAYERTKQWPKAEESFKKALELFPDQPSVLNYLGYSWVDMNINLEEGLEMIRKAVNLRPNDGYIVDSLGWAYYRMGRFDDAVRELERAVELRAADPTINEHLGDAYWRVGRKLEATFQWNHAIDLKPTETTVEAIQKKLEEGLPPLEESTGAAGEATEEKKI
ncbi:MAG: tetratricopeptide repeat protein [Pseudomonadota bacterium]